MNPTVSIIIPCYRQAHFLAETVKSALAQEAASVEVIVINDGSDDDTEGVVRQFGERIRYYRQENGGLPSARNLGIARATGKYLLFLDSDDRLHPKAVSWLTTAAAGREDVLCVMGFRMFQREDEDMEQAKASFPPWEGVPEQIMLLHNFAPPLCYLCSRSMLSANGCFDEVLTSCEDWEAWTRLLFAGAKIVPVYQVGAYYRIHPQSMSRNLVRMAQMRAETLRRTAIRLAADHKGVVPLESNRRAVLRLVRRRRSQELQAAAYFLRDQGRYWASCKHYLASLVSVPFNMTALGGIVKLPLHRVVRGSQLKPATAS